MALSEIGKLIENRLRVMRLSQKELADQIDYGRSHLWAVIHGDRAAGIPLVTELEMALDIDAHKLLDAVLADWRKEQHDRLRHYMAALSSLERERG